MTKKLKLTILVALCTVVAVPGSQAVSATNRIVFNLRAVYQSGTATAPNGTTIDRVATTAYINRNILPHMPGGAANSSLVRITTWTNTTIQTVTSNATYSITSVTYTNLANAGTSNYVTSNYVASASVPIDNESYTVANADGNDTPLTITWTNEITIDTNTGQISSGLFTDTLTNQVSAGYTNISTVSLTSTTLTNSTNSATSTSAASGYYVMTPAPPGPPTLTPLAGLFALTSTNTSNGMSSNTVPLFSWTMVTNAGDEFRGDLGIRGIADWDLGVSYSLDRINLNAPDGSLGFRLEGFDAGSITTAAFGPRGAVGFYPDTNNTVSVVGWGYSDKAIISVTNGSVISEVLTNTTGSTTYIIRGTITTPLYGRIR